MDTHSYDEVMERLKAKIDLIFKRYPGLMMFSFGSSDVFNDEYTERYYPWQSMFSINNVWCTMDRDSEYEGDKDILLGFNFKDESWNEIPATIELMEMAGVLRSLLQSFTAMEYECLFHTEFNVTVTRTGMLVDYFPDIDVYDDE